MNRNLPVSIILFLMFSVSATFAQQKPITGKVTDELGEPLPGVNILLKGTSVGTVSNATGQYSISIPDNQNENGVLIFSFIGFVSQEIIIGGRTTIDVGMATDINTLGEVVVIGYGEVKKEDVTGAVATLGSRDFNKGVVSSPQELLAGRIAGVSVVSDGGAPGSGQTIRIRGGASLNASNDPLIVIDGFPVDNSTNANGTPVIGGISNPLSTINPNDIESFTVLKDASATAIYGSRASNGVILITTKKGASGKPKFNFSSQLAVSEPIKYVNVLKGDEYRDLIHGLFEDGFSGITQQAVDRLGTENTDWQDEIFQTALTQNYNITATGSVKKIPFRFSYGYTDNEGILKTTSMKRHSFSANLNPRFLDNHLSVNVNVKETLAESNFGDPGAVGSAVGFDPTQPVYNNNTRYGGYFTWTTENLPDGSMDPNGAANTFVSNPVALLDLRRNIADVNRLIGNIQLDYKFHFLPELSANLNVGIDKANTDGIDNALPGSTWTYREYTGDNGRLLDYTGINTSKLLDFYLKYNKRFGSNALDLTAGYSWQNFEREGTTFDRNGDGTQVLEDSEYFNEVFLVSFFGRLNYSLNDKYLLTATLRNDGSSRFIGDNKFGLFPSVALAWKLDQESFLAGVEQVSMLKLRLGYGVTGQQNINAGASPQYPALALFRQSIGGASYQFGNEFIQTYRPNPYDPNIKWEETTTYNIGLDFGLWKDRITGAIEVYKRETEDLIGTIPIPGGTNFSNYLTTNVGNMENNGVEITLTTRPISTPDVNWQLGVNLAHNKTEITKLTKTDNPEDPGVNVGGISGGVGNNIQIHTVGYAPFSFYPFQQVYNSAGEPVEGIYVDRSESGGLVTSNQLNRYHYHSPVAEVLLGINSSLTYKNIDFSFSGRISIDNYVYNNVKSTSTFSGLYDANDFFNNMRRSAYEVGFTNPQYWSDLYVENASFFKMDVISLGYTLENLAHSKVKARLSFTVQNAFIITDYEGIDPELSNGIDNNIYPRPRTFQFGVSIDF